MFIEHLVQSHSLDEEHADANRLKVLKYMNVSHVLKTIDCHCGHFLDYCNSNFPQVFDFLCSLDPEALLLSISTHDFSSLENESLWDFSKLSNYIKAGFMYFSDISGILFCRDRKGISVLDYALETFGEAKVGKLLRDLLSLKKDIPILHRVFVEAEKHKDFFLSWAA